MLKESVKCLCTALAVLLIAAIPANAGTAGLDSKARIPFDFVIAGKTLPAGEYTLEVTAGQRIVAIRDDNGVQALTIMSRAAGSPQQDNRPHLVFRKLGGKYFLNGVWTGLSPSRTQLK